MSSPIEIVRNLQELVCSTYSLDTTAGLFAKYKAKHAISSLCLSLLRAVQGPEEYTAILAESCQESSALNVITSLGIADLIAASPTGELTLKELSEKTRANEQYLSVALSALLYHGYFIEVGSFGSQIYANNSFSNILRAETPESGAKTMKEAVGLAADDGAKASTRLLEAAIAIDATGNPDDKTAANFAFNSSQTLFEWMASPGNEWRGRRAGKAMVQLHGMANGGIGDDYPWETLSSPIIDIGGGIGSFEIMLLSKPKNMELSFTIFDIEKTVGNAQTAWATKPQWMQDKVSFVAGDFTKSDPSESKIPTTMAGAGTYVIRHVLHDWADAQVLDILTNVKNAMLVGATGNRPTKLLVVEMALTETSSRFTRTTSLQLLSLSGGVTRTEVQFRTLFSQAGFRVDAVSTVRGVDLIVELTPTLE